MTCHISALETDEEELTLRILQQPSLENFTTQAEPINYGLFWGTWRKKTNI